MKRHLRTILMTLVAVVAVICLAGMVSAAETYRPAVAPVVSSH